MVYMRQIPAVHKLRQQACNGDFLLLACRKPSKGEHCWQPCDLSDWLRAMSGKLLLLLFLPATVELTYNYGVDSYDIGEGFGHFGVALPDVYKTAGDIKQGRNSESGATHSVPQQ